MSLDSESLPGVLNLALRKDLPVPEDVSLDVIRPSAALYPAPSLTRTLPVLNGALVHLGTPDHGSW